MLLFVHVLSEPPDCANRRRFLAPSRTNSAHQIARIAIGFNVARRREPRKISTKKSRKLISKVTIQHLASPNFSPS
jgi:hypothetical protein